MEPWIVFCCCVMCFIWGVGVRDRDLKGISRSEKGLPSKWEERTKIYQKTGQKVCSTLEIFNQTDTSTDSLLGFQNYFPAVHGAWHLFGANWLGHRYCMYLLSHIVVVLDANVITELTMAVSGGQHILHILASHCQNNYTDYWHSCYILLYG